MEGLFMSNRGPKSVERLLDLHDAALERVFVVPRACYGERETAEMLGIYDEKRRERFFREMVRAGIMRRMPGRRKPGRRKRAPAEFTWESVANLILHVYGGRTVELAARLMALGQAALLPAAFLRKLLSEVGDPVKVAEWLPAVEQLGGFVPLPNRTFPVPEATR